MYRFVTAAVFGVGVLALSTVTIVAADPDDGRHDRAEPIERREPRQRELEELHRHLEELQAKQEDLARTDDIDARERVERKIEEVKHHIVRVEDEHRGSPDDRPDDRHRELDKLHRHLEQLHAKREELAQTDDIDARQRVEQEIEATKHHIARVEDGHRGGPDDRPDDRHRELEELHEHLGQLQSKHEELASTDDIDNRKHVEQQIEEVNQQIARIEHGLPRPHREFDPDDTHRPDDSDEIVRRIEHLHRAAENLAQAGERDLAHDLHARAEDMERELHRRRGHDEAEHHGDGPHELREIHAAIHELRREVARLRDQVNEQRQIVKRRD